MLFKLWCWRRLLRVPRIARRSNQSIRKEISPKLQGLMLKLKLQYFGHLMQWRTDSLEKTRCLERLKAGGEGDNRGWHVWMASWTHWTWVWENSRRWWRTEKPGMLSPWSCTELDMTEWLNKNEVLLYSIGNSAQYYVAAWMGAEFWRMDTCICMVESIFCPPETITTMLISSTPI